MKQHKIAKRFEVQIAEDLGGRRVFLSGAGDEKADVRVGRRFKKTDDGIVPTEGRTFRIEAKTTSRSHYSFKVVDWDDVARAANRAGEEPIFAVSFSAARNQDYVLIRSSFAAELGFNALLPTMVRRSWNMDAKLLLLGRQRTVIFMTDAEHPVVLVLAHYNAFLKALESRSG